MLKETKCSEGAYFWNLRFSKTTLRHQSNIKFLLDPADIKQTAFSCHSPLLRAPLHKFKWTPKAHYITFLHYTRTHSQQQQQQQSLFSFLF